jgi:histidinol-phosphate phosphatase family protein
VRILFLDRDGTLNRSIEGRPPNSPHEVELLPGVEKTLSDYADQGWLVVIVSNQGGVASGYISEAGARAVQQRVIDLLPVPVAASYFCPHMLGGRVAEYARDCPNRKPKPGFILTALEQLSAQAQDCLFVGDSSTDRLAAEAARVPFRWADLFFGRPIERGVQMESGGWVQACQVEPAEWQALIGLACNWGEPAPQPDVAARPDSLALVVRNKAAPVGWLSLVRSKSGSEADLAFGVDAAHSEVAREEGLRGSGIGGLLLECALDWARAQPGLKRLCVRVRADILRAAQLCCRYGFGEWQAQPGVDGTGWVQLGCSL